MGIGEVAQFPLDPLLCLSNEDEMGDTLRHQFSKRSILAPLVLATSYQGYIGRKTFQGLDHAPHIGPLAVLIIGNTIHLPHKLHAVGKAGKPLYCGAGFPGITPHQEGTRQGGHDVVYVMHPFKPEPCDIETLFTSFPAENYRPIAVVNALFQYLLLAGGNRPRLNFPGNGGHKRVIHIKHGKIVSGLVLEDPQLGIDIFLIGCVAIQMVFGDVEQHRHPRSR